MSRAIALLIASIVVAACSGAPASSPPATTAPVAQTPATNRIELSVLAAASLKPALEAAVTAYESENPGVKLVLSTDSSAALETKIEQGAPADVFLSADTSNPQKLIDGTFAAGPALVFAGNMLTLIVPSDNPAGITSAADLAKTGVKVVAAGDEVPITRYAKLLLANLASEAGYPADFEARYAANVVTQEENVKAVVAKIELGQGDVAIVYVTDAGSGVKTIDVPATANVLASYAGVMLKASSHAAAAQAFLDWLLAADGQAILASFGFLPPAP